MIVFHVTVQSGLFVFHVTGHDCFSCYSSVGIVFPVMIVFLHVTVQSGLFFQSGLFSCYSPVRIVFHVTVFHVTDQSGLFFMLQTGLDCFPCYS